MQTKKIAVFDFDGTIVSKNTGFLFYKWLIVHSPIRLLIFVLFSPLSTLLILIGAKTRCIGFSINSYIATAFRNDSLFQLRARFIDYYFGKCKAIVYSDALKRFKMHQKNNDKLIIISGCPAWLLWGIKKHIGLVKVEVVGSIQKLSNKGLLFTKHCYSHNKVNMAKARGLNPIDWHYGYTDGTEDIHWLKYCQKPHIINASPRKMNRFRKSIPTLLLSESWK